MSRRAASTDTPPADRKVVRCAVYPGARLDPTAVRAYAALIGVNWADRFGGDDDADDE